MINYEWDCRTVDVYPSKEDLTNVIYNVHYRVTGTDEDNISETIIGTIGLNTENIIDFISIDQLTNDNVVVWVKETMGEDQVSSIENAIASTIDDKKNPKSITMTID